MISHQPTLDGLESPPKRYRYVLSAEEAGIIERYRKDRKSMSSRDEYIKSIILAILKYPEYPYKIHQQLNSGRAGSISYYAANKYLLDLERENKIMRAGRKWRRS